MKKIWNYIDSKNWTETVKFRCIILLWSIISALTGFTLWLVIRNWALASMDWMICFIGYPVVISWISTILYALKHEFH